MSAEGSTRAIIAAFVANLGIAVAKLVGFLITGASSMLAEAVHSLADTGNQGLLLLGGISLLAGAWTRIGSFFLLVFIVAATYYFHEFWKFADPTQRQLQTIQFMKNLAISGGLLSLIAFGGGPWSVDGWITKRREEVETGVPAAKPRVTAKAA
jgi:putative oxidoreductase